MVRKVRRWRAHLCSTIYSSLFTIHGRQEINKHTYTNEWIKHTENKQKINDAWQFASITLRTVTGTLVLWDNIAIHFNILYTLPQNRIPGVFSCNSSKHYQTSINQSIIYLLKIKSKWQIHTNVSSKQDNKAISALTVAIKTYIHIHLHIHTQ